jgi:DHA1 family multidrug resistance protein-like MFS transporter
MSLGRVAGPLWAGFVFDPNLIYPYISGAVTMLISFIISLVWLKGDEPASVLGKSANHSTPS